MLELDESQSITIWSLLHNSIADSILAFRWNALYADAAVFAGEVAGSQPTSRKAIWASTSVPVQVPVRWFCSKSCYHFLTTFQCTDFFLSHFDPHSFWIFSVVRLPESWNFRSQNFSSACRRPFWKPMQCIGNRHCIGTATNIIGRDAAIYLTSTKDDHSLKR